MGTNPDKCVVPRRGYLTLDIIWQWERLARRRNPPWHRPWSRQIANRHDTVVRQFDRILAIVKGRQEGEMGFLSNVLAEDELYR